MSMSKHVNNLDRLPSHAGIPLIYPSVLESHRGWINHENVRWRVSLKAFQLVVPVLPIVSTGYYQFHPSS